jgi:hypothetical protein
MVTALIISLVCPIAGNSNSSNSNSSISSSSNSSNSNSNRSFYSQWGGYELFCLIVVIVTGASCRLLFCLKVVMVVAVIVTGAYIVYGVAMSFLSLTFSINCDGNTI